MASPPTADEVADEKRLIRQQCEQHCEFLDRLFKEILALRDQAKQLENQ